MSWVAWLLAVVAPWLGPMPPLARYPSLCRSDCHAARTAHILEKAIRRGRPVPYDGNIAVETVVETRKHRFVSRETNTPLIYDPAPSTPGRHEYFEVLDTQGGVDHVRPIPPDRITGIKCSLIAEEHPGRPVVSHRGVIRNRQGMAGGPAPSVVARLSGGETVLLDIGWTEVSLRPQKPCR